MADCMILAVISLKFYLLGTLKFLAPYYGLQVARLAFTQIYLIALGGFAFGLLSRFSTNFKYTLKRNSSFIVISISLLMLANPFFVFSTRRFTAVLGPYYGPILSSFPFCLALALVNYDSARASLLSCCWIIAFEAFVFTTFADSQPMLSSFIDLINRLPACSILRLANIFLLASNSKLLRKRRLYSLLFLAFSSNYLYRILGINQAQLPSNVPVEFALNQSVLARSESNTGFVSVVVTSSFHGLIKVMRCDHSILGGVYLEHGNDGIFKSFYMMDFVRFVKRNNHLDFTKDTITNKIALQIGLGIGASASTLMETGIVMDVVELDPILYKYARDFFSFPKPRSAHLFDGRLYLNEQANLKENHLKYDYILHDVFTGGLVPSSLFSLQAWEKIKFLLKKNGTLAVNFVGAIDSPSTQAILATLKRIFPHISVFKEIEEASNSEMMNLVFFCSSSQQIRFDFSQDSENLPSSPTYHSILEQFKNQKDALPAGLENVEIITDQLNPLTALQDQTVIDHFYAVDKIFSFPYFWSDLF